MGTSYQRYAAQACFQPPRPTWIPTVTSWLFSGWCRGEDAPSQVPQTKISTWEAVPCKEVNVLYQTVPYFGAEATAWLLFHRLRKTVENYWRSVLKQFPGGPVGKNLPANAGAVRSSPGSGRSPGEGIGNLLWCSCLEIFIDRGAWRRTVHGVAESQTWPSTHTTHTAKSHASSYWCYTHHLAFPGNPQSKSGELHLSQGGIQFWPLDP